ncbi:hypothetical protein [Sphingobacterium rhinopitheci]|uniref:hypothetical protein n=1 Tax=Sphingobacterium rhinopitheci TaxID=2781960 RepID=UPI001F528C86|nr:hypothetical protein [Sphingobacterium rhinopitheci]MCI0921595.1 hypothetical protein [Sphingobacterium rhinopitheci]
MKKSIYTKPIIEVQKIEIEECLAQSSSFIILNDSSESTLQIKDWESTVDSINIEFN